MKNEREKYGGKFNENLLEQYKLYVEMADKISERREKTNQFYLSLMSLFIILISFIEKSIIIILFIVSFIGILWFLNIQAHKQLNSAKFEIIHKMEHHLPFNCYEEEWDLLKEKRYLEITKIEQAVPIILIVISILMTFFS